MIAAEGRKEDSLITLADLIQRLTKGWTDHIPVIVLGRVITKTITYPGLLDQLDQALSESTPTDPTHRSIPDSTPPVPEPPFDVLLAFHRFTRTAPTPLDQLVGWASTAHPDTAAAIVLELWALTRRAEIVLGHRYAPRAIDGVCPACDASRSLRVNMTEHGPIDAYCTKCHIVWDTPELGILARMLEVR